MAIETSLCLSAGDPLPSKLRNPGLGGWNEESSDIAIETSLALSPGSIGAWRFRSSVMAIERMGW